MMTSPDMALVVRDATARDSFVVAQVLVAAFTGSGLGRWLDGDEVSGPCSLLPGVTALVTEALAVGVVRVVEVGGRVVAAALWSVGADRPAGAPGDALPAGGVRRAGVCGRWTLVEELAESRRPSHVAHQRLVLFGVQPDRQGEGLSTHLLIDHHALLHVMGVAAYTVADESVYGLLQRHGYTSIGPPGLLPGGMPVRAMWRPPMPADLQ